MNRMTSILQLFNPRSTLGRDGSAGLDGDVEQFGIADFRAVYHHDEMDQLCHCLLLTDLSCRQTTNY